MRQVSNLLYLHANLFDKLAICPTFTLDSEEFDRGTIVLKVPNNKNGLKKKLEQLSEKHGVEFVPTDTSWTEKGLALGSRNVVYLEKPTRRTLRSTSVYTFVWMDGLPF